MITPNELSGEYKEMYDRLVMAVDTNIKLQSVILSDENKEKVGEFITETVNAEKLARYNLKPMNRMLLYGDSGTGKTYLSKALANHLGYTMLYVDIAESLSSGNVARNVSDIFKLAAHMERCIVFFDEVDSIAWSRDSDNAESGDIRRATNSLFQQLDQMSTKNIFLAASNMIYRLDPAFRRRFNLKLEFRKPQADIVEAVRKFLLPQFQLLNNLNETIRTIADRRMSLSYYEIQVIVERAMKKSALADTSIVKLSDIYNDFIKAAGIEMRYSLDEEEI